MGTIKNQYNEIDIIRMIPKTEVHLHIEGLASLDSIWELKQKHKLNLKVRSKKHLSKKFNIKNLTQFINVFINIVQACFIEEEDIEYLIDDAYKYLKRNNIVYAEVFFSPTRFLRNGMQFEKIVQRFHDSSIRIEKEHGIEMRFLVDVSRTFGPENARQNLELILHNRSERIIGLGLGGSEQIGPAREYIDVFEKAIENGLHVVAHAGEVIGPESIWDAIDLLKVERVGHGTSAFLDNKLISELRYRRIPLEICPTSNLHTGKYATELSKHPIRQYYDSGLFVTVNSDDPVLFDSELNAEYENLLNNDIFSLLEIIGIIRNGIYATFLTKERKDAMWANIKKRMAQKFPGIL